MFFVKAGKVGSPERGKTLQITGAEGPINGTPFRLPVNYTGVLDKQDKFYFSVCILRVFNSVLNKNNERKNEKIQNIYYIDTFFY